jgi:trimethylamine:corrinoid methyltransferase-like protein
VTQVPYRHQLGADFIAADQAQRVHEMALRILAEAGLAVGLESARQRLVARGTGVGLEAQLEWGPTFSLFPQCAYNRA